MCKASLVIQIQSQLLSPTDIASLTDRAALKTRYELTLKDHAKAQEITPTGALDTFRSYVRDSINNDDPNKKIPEQNKRFMGALGRDAGDLLTRLGFRYQAANPNQSIAYWYLPKPIDSVRGTDEPLRTILEDMKDEIDVMIETIACQERGSDIGESFPSTFNKDIQRLMGSLDYEKNLFAGHNLRSQSQHDFIFASFNTLGALPDFSDRLVAFTYDRQAESDPSSIPTYLQCLKDIAANRGSEALQTKYVTLESQGHLSQSSISEAYSYFNINPSHAETINDNHILDLFRSRVPDIGADELPRMKMALRTLGDARNSQMLINAATDAAMETYEQALAFFDIDANQSDDFIPSLVAVKVAEDPSNRELTRKAVQLIADHRNSAALKYYLERGDLPSGELELNEAFNLLNISDPDQVSDEHVLAAYTNAISVSPTRVEELRRALDKIATHRDSPVLLWESQQVRQNAGHPDTPMDEPRGLRNIGNTCYLNSLLQYFFSIAPVRHAVENIEQNKEEPFSATHPTKRVGNERVNYRQVDRSLQFVNELGKLFARLITARELYIQPEEKLARLTLHVEQQPEQAIRRRSTLTGQKATLTSPTLNIPASADSKDQIVEHDSAVEMSTSPEKLNSLDPNLSGGSTIRNDPAENAENADLSKEAQPEINDRSVAFSDQVDNAAAEGMSFKQDAGGSDHGSMDIGPPTPPAQESGMVNSGPPPIPPRPEESGARAEYEEWAQQHDVQEVIENVLYQLRWSMRAERTEANGEQVDAISRLFYGKEEYTTFAEKESTETQSFCYQFIYPHASSLSVYDALDSAFDKSDLDEPGHTQYKTIIEAPPVFQIYLNRVTWDTEAKETKKIMSQLKLDHEIYIDRYMADQEMLVKRKQSWILKEKLQNLKAKREAMSKTDVGLKIPDVLTGMKTYLAETAPNDLDNNPSTMNEDDTATLDQLADQARQEIKDLDLQISEAESQLKELFDQSGTHKYRLHCVFVHRGDAQRGHWFTYIHNPKDDKWRSYNDENVTIVTDTAAIYEPDSSRHGTSAFVTYVLADKESDIVDTVCRNPEAAPERPNLSMIEGNAAPPPYQEAIGVVAGDRDEQNPTEETTRVYENGYCDGKRLFTEKQLSELKRSLHEAEIHVDITEGRLERDPASEENQDLYKKAKHNRDSMRDVLRNFYVKQEEYKTWKRKESAAPKSGLKVRWSDEQKRARRESILSQSSNKVNGIKGSHLASPSKVKLIVKDKENKESGEAKHFDAIMREVLSNTSSPSTGMDYKDSDPLGNLKTNVHNALANFESLYGSKEQKSPEELKQTESDVRVALSKIQIPTNDRSEDGLIDYEAIKRKNLSNIKAPSMDDNNDTEDILLPDYDSVMREDLAEIRNPPAQLQSPKRRRPDDYPTRIRDNDRDGEDWDLPNYDAAEGKGNSALSKNDKENQPPEKTRRKGG